MLPLPCSAHGCWRRNPVPCFAAVSVPDLLAAAVLWKVAMLHVHLSLCTAIFKLSQGKGCFCWSCLAAERTKNHFFLPRKGFCFCFEACCSSSELLSLLLKKEGRKTAIPFGTCAISDFFSLPFSKSKQSSVRFWWSVLFILETPDA